MLFDILSGDRGALVSLLLSLPVILFALSFHEAAHGYIAYKMGDPTARNLGRLTLNPLKHLDPFGAVAMLVFGYGWAKPVPINTRNFDNPRIGMALTGIAGPVSNLILGVISSLLYVANNVIYNTVIMSKIEAGQISEIQSSIENGTGVLGILMIVSTFFYISSILNFGLMAFNLIPVPPFDGSRFFYIFLPSKWYFKVMKYEQTIMIVILVAFLALGRAGYSPISGIANWLFGIITEPLTKLAFSLIG